MRNVLQRLIWLACLGVLASSCAHGLRTTVCIVDYNNSGFQCSGEKKKLAYFLAFEKGKDLLCYSPTDTENFVKACKDHIILPVTSCSYSNGAFLCIDPSKGSFYISPLQASNYFCLSPRDHSRLIERCRLR